MPDEPERPRYAWGMDGMVIGLLAGLGCAFVLGGFVRTWDAAGSALERATWAESLLVYAGGLGAVGYAAGAVRGWRVVAGAAFGWAVFMAYAAARLPVATWDDRLWWLGRWSSFGLIGGALVGGAAGFVFLFLDEKTGRFRSGGEVRP